MMDVFAEAEGLKRRRALLEALSNQSAAPKITGGYGPAQLLAALATNSFAGSGLKDVDQGIEDNRGRYQQEMGSGLERFMGAYDADPKKAVFEAVASRFPEVQAAGKAGMTEAFRKPEKATENWVEETRNIDGKPILVRRNTVNGKIEQVGTGPTVNVQNVPENRAAAHSLTTTIDAVQPKGESYVSAKSAQQNLMSTTEAVDAIRRGAETGALENVVLGARKIAERLGIPQAETAPTDQLSSLLKARVFAKLGGLGVAISDADRQFMSGASGDITTDPKALKRLLALDAAASIKEVNRHNQRVDAISGQYPEQSANRLSLNWMPGDDPEFDQMVQNALAGRPTSMNAPGKTPSPAAGPKPAARVPQSRDPRIIFTPTGN